MGRLDKDTTGLLLLTDDGELAHRLLSPKYHVDKRYLAQVDGALAQADVAAFAGGITLADGTECLPAGLELLPEHRCIVTLRQGKFHQVKRMLASRRRAGGDAAPAVHGSADAAGDAAARPVAALDRGGSEHTAARMWIVIFSTEPQKRRQDFCGKEKKTLAKSLL